MEHSELSTKAYEHIKARPLCTFGSVDEEGSPCLASVYVFIEPDFSCYFITKTQSRKFENVQARPSCALLSSSEETLFSVEVKGQVSVVGDTLMVVAITDRFREMIAREKGNFWEPPIAQIQSGEYVVCTLTPQSVRISNFVDTTEETGGAQVVTLSTADLRGVL